jgi:PAS domain-containing protein
MLERTEGIAHVGSWEWDIASDTVIWSDELFRIFQRDPQEGAPSFAEHPALYHPDDMERLRQAVEAAVADGTPYELELQAIRKDGETRTCLARGVAEMGIGGRAVRLFGLLQDITERARAESALKKAKTGTIN